MAIRRYKKIFEYREYQVEMQMKKKKKTILTSISQLIKIPRVTGLTPD